MKRFAVNRNCFLRAGVRDRGEKVENISRCIPGHYRAVIFIGNGKKQL